MKNDIYLSETKEREIHKKQNFEEEDQKEVLFRSSKK
jgi:hypothetical protein